jgi:hypothetical protein
MLHLHESEFFIEPSAGPLVPIRHELLDRAKSGSSKGVYVVIRALTLATLISAEWVSLAQAGDLNLWYSDAREDNFSTVTEAGRSDARAANYRKEHLQACIFGRPAEGLVPLKLYWHSGRGDNFSTSTSDGERDALNAGYQLVRIQGYVYRDAALNLVPLYTYWNSARGDNFLAVTNSDISAARSAGYHKVRIEGYAISGQCPF